MGRDRRRIRRDQLASSRRGRPVVAVAGMLVALVGMWLVVGRPTGADVAVPHETNAPAIRAPTGPPISASNQPAATRTPTTMPQAAPMSRPVTPTTSLPATRAQKAGPGGPRRILLPQIGVSARVNG
jgi:hypothetical protein